MTARGLSAQNKTASEAGTVVPVLFVELDFASGVSRLCDAGQSIVWNGFTWLGAGSVGGIETIEEGADLQARGVALTLAGVNPALVAVAKTEDFQGRDVRIYLGLLDPVTYQVLPTPEQVWGGQMDTMTIVLDRQADSTPTNATIRLACESRLVRWDTPNVRRYTHEDQQIDFPGDRFFEFVPSLQDRPIPWP